MSYSGDTSPGGSFNFVKKERRGRRSELPDDVAKKLKSCSVLGCEEWRDLTSHTTYHCFPTGDKNQQRWEIWTSLLQKAREDPTWIPFRGSLVCSHHFRMQDFVHDPNQKRTKLVKNAIPSVFPTFTVDLDDPSFMLDDTSEFDGEVETPYFDESYDYSNQDSLEYEQEPDLDENYAEITVPEVQYEDEDIDESDLQYVHPRQSQTRSRPPTLIPGRNSPDVGASSSSARNSHEIFTMDEEPPKKKIQLSNSSGIKVSAKPSMAYQGSVKIEEINGSSSKQNIRSVSKTTGSKLYEQLCKSNASTEGSSKLPFSWNPDLEIEVLEPSSDDFGWKQKYEEIENEKEVLKRKYEAQIRALQRKVKEQDRIINEYAIQMNNLKRQRT